MAKAKKSPCGCVTRCVKETNESEDCTAGRRVSAGCGRVGMRGATRVAAKRPPRAMSAEAAQRPASSTECSAASGTGVS